MRLIDDWRTEVHRLLSINISVAYGTLNGVLCVIGAFTDILNPWLLLAIAVVVNIAVIPLARLVKQADRAPKD